MNKKKRTGYNPLDDLLPQIKDTRENDKPQKTDKKPQAKPKLKAETISQTFTQTYPQTSANNIKEMAIKKTGHQRLEDNRRRQTYWMDPEEIKMIAEISKTAGVGKYRVVSAAVRMLYEYVFSRDNVEE